MEVHGVIQLMITIIKVIHGEIQIISKIIMKIFNLENQIIVIMKVMYGEVQTTIIQITIIQNGI